MRLFVTLLVFMLVSALFIMPGCGSGSATEDNPDNSSIDPTDSSFEPGGGSDAEQCTEGNDSGLTGPVMSFETLEDGRYCEVLIFYTQDDGTIMADVYNSLPFGNCPQEIWETLDVDVIQEDFPDAHSINLNGPRYFLMQDLLSAPSQSQSQPSVHDFGGIQMFRAATVVADSLGQGSYSSVTVNRDNTWRFTAGNRVHELIDTEGNVYTMQSFSRIVDEALSFEDLEILGERLSVPEGWRYRVRILQVDLDVQAIGTATVLQDELKNTYQWRSDCQIQ